MLPSLISLTVPSDAPDRTDFLSAPDWDGDNCFDCVDDCVLDENSDTRPSDCIKLCQETQKTVRDIILQQGFTVEREMCGQEGQVCLVRSNTTPKRRMSVKIMVVDDKDAHRYRCHLWKAAENAGVGPMVYFDACEKYVLPTKDGYQFYSFVYMERISKLPTEMESRIKLLSGVVSLFSKTVSIGLIHTDAHWDNIMTRRGSGELLFVDWEAGVVFNGNGPERDAAERIMWAKLWNSAHGGMAESLKKLAKTRGEQWTTIKDDKAELTLAVAKSVLDNYKNSIFLYPWEKEARRTVVIMTALEHDITMLEAAQILASVI